jgi:hypothetical protein
VARGNIENFYVVSVYALTAMLAIGLGFIASTGNFVAVVAAIGLIVGLLILSNPLYVLWSVLLGGLIVSGLAMLYAPQLQLVRWAVALASIVLIAMALLDQIASQGRRDRSDMPAIGWQIAALFVVVAIAGWANGQGAMQLVVGLKSYFQVAGLFFALVFIPWPQRVLDALPKAMLYTAFLQLPFAMHQLIFLVPRRVGYGEGVVAYDVIAGTFGASMFGGGANAVLSAFLLMVIAVLLALWNNRAISLNKLVLLGAPLLAPIFFNESKVSVLYLLIIVLIIFKNEIALRPARALVSGGIAAMLLAGLMFAYAALYADESKGPADLIAGTIQQNFSTDTGHGQFYLNRWTAITFWAKEHTLTNPVPMLLGHGPRASREGGSGLDAGVTLASQRYPGLGIGLTGVSAVLWEAGLLGAGLVAAMFWTAYTTAGKLRERHKGQPYEAGLFSGLQAGVAILMLSMCHKSFFVFDIGYQSILMLLFGYLAWHAGRATPLPVGATKPSLSSAQHLR